MKVLIRKVLQVYVLSFETDQKVCKAYTFNRLIDAIGTASVLQVHIDNIGELALAQYLNERGE